MGAKEGLAKLLASKETYYNDPKRRITGALTVAALGPAALAMKVGAYVGYDLDGTVKPSLLNNVLQQKFTSDAVELAGDIANATWWLILQLLFVLPGMALKDKEEEKITPAEKTPESEEAKGTDKTSPEKDVPPEVTPEQAKGAPPQKETPPIMTALDDTLPEPPKIMPQAMKETVSDLLETLSSQTLSTEEEQAAIRAAEKEVAQQMQGTGIEKWLEQQSQQIEQRLAEQQEDARKRGREEEGAEEGPEEGPHAKRVKANQEKGQERPGPE